MRSRVKLETTGITNLCPTLGKRGLAGQGAATQMDRLIRYELEAEVRGDLIILTEPITEFVAIYVKPSSQRRLVLMRRSPTNDSNLLAQAEQTANVKARELGWVV